MNRKGPTAQIVSCFSKCMFTFDVRTFIVLTSKTSFCEMWVCWCHVWCSNWIGQVGDCIWTIEAGDADEVRRIFDNLVDVDVNLHHQRTSCLAFSDAEAANPILLHNSCQEDHLHSSAPARLSLSPCVPCQCSWRTMWITSECSKVSMSLDML